VLVFAAITIAHQLLEALASSVAALPSRHARCIYLLIRDGLLQRNVHLLLEVLLDLV
jgi:hypothetical protein